MLTEENKKLKEQLEKLKSNQIIPHNARGAGRKKHDDAWMKKYLAFCDLVKSGTSMEDIMTKTDISRSTYFRLLKEFRKKQEKEN